MCASDRRLSFLKIGDCDDCPLDEGMMQQEGWCYEFDGHQLAREVGVHKVWRQVFALVRYAMEQWAAADARDGKARVYSLWAGSREGAGAHNQLTTLVIVGVVEHACQGADARAAAEAEAPESTPFDVILPRAQGFVRCEGACPLWSGAELVFLVRGWEVLTGIAGTSSYRLTADAALADLWQGQEKLREIAGDLVIMDETGADAQRGALAYLRHFARHRRVFELYDLPEPHALGAPAPQWLQNYFDQGGQLFHAQDWRDAHQTALLVVTPDLDLVLDAPFDWGLHIDTDAMALQHVIVFRGDVRGDLGMPFVYSLQLRGDLEELASVVTQGSVPLYVFVQPSTGPARLVGTRWMHPDERALGPFALAVARIVRLSEPSATLLPAEPARAEDEDAPDPTAALAALRDRDRRVWGVQQLCATRDPAYAADVIRVAERMSWREVDAVWQYLPMLGQAAVESFVALAHSGKKSAAACAIRALGRIPCPRSLEVLRELVETRGSKGEPAEALVELGEFAIPTLVQLSHDRTAEVRWVAAYALGKIGGGEAEARLTEMARQDKSGRVRAVAATALLWVRGVEECSVDLRDLFGGLRLPDPRGDDDP